MTQAMRVGIEGGTGKTPLILWMIEHCQRSGLWVGVVSRGYGAKPPQLPWRVEGGQSAAIAGDEPLFMRYFLCRLPERFQRSSNPCC